MDINADIKTMNDPDTIAEWPVGYNEMKIGNLQELWLLIYMSDFFLPTPGKRK